MAVTMPDKYRDLLETKKAFAHLATVMKDRSEERRVGKECRL